MKKESEKNSGGSKRDWRYMGKGQPLSKVTLAKLKPTIKKSGGGQPEGKVTQAKLKPVADTIPSAKAPINSEKSEECVRNDEERNENKKEDEGEYEQLLNSKNTSNLKR